MRMFMICFHDTFHLKVFYCLPVYYDIHNSETLTYQLDHNIHMVAWFSHIPFKLNFWRWFSSISSKVLAQALVLATCCWICKVSPSYSATFHFSISFCLADSSATFDFSITAWSSGLLLLVELAFDDDLDVFYEDDDQVPLDLFHGTLPFWLSILFVLCFFQATVSLMLKGKWFFIKLIKPLLNLSSLVRFIGSTILN